MLVDERDCIIKMHGGLESDIVNVVLFGRLLQRLLLLLLRRNEGAGVVPLFVLNLSGLLVDERLRRVRCHAGHYWFG